MKTGSGHPYRTPGSLGKPKSESPRVTVISTGKKFRVVLVPRIRHMNDDDLEGCRGRVVVEYNRRPNATGDPSWQIPHHTSEEKSMLIQALGEALIDALQQRPEWDYKREGNWK